MKTWLKILIAFLGSGLNGGLAFASSQFPDWAVIFASTVVVVSALMSKLIGWPPKAEA